MSVRGNSAQKDSRQQPLVVPTALTSNIHKKYKFHEVLGEGSFAVVRRCTSKRRQRCNFLRLLLTSDASSSSAFSQYACKSIVKSRLSVAITDDSPDGCNPYYVKAIRREIECLQSLSSDPVGAAKKSDSALDWSDSRSYILQLHKVYEDANHIHMLTDLCPNSLDLYDYLHSRTDTQLNPDKCEPLPESLASSIARQVLSALAYCHECNIAHRDIKPDNILIIQGENNTVTIKLIDFGLARKINDPIDGSEPQPMKSRVGTVYYVAPEVLTSGSYNEKCDIWGVGVILYLLLTGKLPFLGSSERATLKLAQTGKFEFEEDHRHSRNDDESNPAATEKPLSSGARDCCRYLVQLDTAKRPSARQAMRHHWLAKTDQPPISGFIESESKGPIRRLRGAFRRRAPAASTNDSIDTINDTKDYKTPISSQPSGETLLAV